MSDDALGSSLPCYIENTCQFSETGRKRIVLSHSVSHFISQMFYGIQVRTVRAAGAGQSIRRFMTPPGTDEQFANDGEEHCHLADARLFPVVQDGLQPMEADLFVSIC